MGQSSSIAGLRRRRACVVILSLLIVIPAGLNSVAEFSHGTPTSKVPLLIKQGPLFTQQQASSKYAWYQVGAIGESGSYNYVAANITIRTVYDKAIDDAHSYWVGGHLSNGAFIQVGYLTSVSTTGQQYCCAWFYEYFPAGQTVCCDPVIGPEASAGPIGSYHEYSMIHTGNGVWSFYFDGALLGATPALGATNSGSNSPAGIAEVAQTLDNTDTLGPAEFSDMLFRTLTGGWQSVPTGNSLITYGEGTRQNAPPNPYGAREVTGVNNNFLAGSEIPQLDPPSSSPGRSLWPVVVPSYLFTARFTDSDALSFAPDWVSLREVAGARKAFYTGLKNDYRNLRIDSGNWYVDNVWWHAVNVSGQMALIAIPTSVQITIQTSVSSLKLRVQGLIFGFPVATAKILTTLPDTTTVSASTDSSGIVIFRQLPPGTYYLRITVPYGFSYLTVQTVPAPEVITRVLGQAELLLAVLVPIILAVIAAVYAVQRDRKRAAFIVALSETAPYLLSCPICGSSVHSATNYCSACGSPLIPQPPTNPSVT